MLLKTTYKTHPTVAENKRSDDHGGAERVITRFFCCALRSLAIYSGFATSLQNRPFKTFRQQGGISY